MGREFKGNNSSRFDQRLKFIDVFYLEWGGSVLGGFPELFVQEQEYLLMVVKCGVPPEHCLSSMCIHSNEWCCKQLKLGRLPQRNPPGSACVSTLPFAMVSHRYMTGSNAQYTSGK